MNDGIVSVCFWSIHLLASQLIRERRSPLANASMLAYYHLPPIKCASSVNTSLLPFGCYCSKQLNMRLNIFSCFSTDCWKSFTATYCLLIATLMTLLSFPMEIIMWRCTSHFLTSWTLLLTTNTKLYWQPNDKKLLTCWQQKYLSKWCWLFLTKICAFTCTPIHPCNRE